MEQMWFNIIFGIIILGYIFAWLSPIMWHFIDKTKAEIKRGECTDREGR